jgi:hypothetical protein
MKKLGFILVILLVLPGCTGLPSLPFLGLTPSAAPQPTATPFALDSTNTPDLFVLNTLPPTTTPSDGTSIVTDTPIPTLTATMRPTITLEPIDPIFFTPSPNLFLTVQRSADQIVWGGSCEGARFIKFTATVQYVRRLRYVTLWYRLQDKYSGRHTDWGGGAIFADNDQGLYWYTLDLSQISGYRNYTDAWFQYQFVASTVSQKVLGRSIVSRNEVSLTHCMLLP